MSNSVVCPDIVLFALIGFGFVAFGLFAPDATLLKMRAAGWLRPTVAPISIFRALFFAWGGAFLFLALLFTVDAFTPLIVWILSG